jgi:hypothetical protein
VPGRAQPASLTARIDYANMELVTRAVGLAVWSLATSEQAPRWMSANPNAAPYAKARDTSASALSSGYQMPGHSR